MSTSQKPHIPLEADGLPHGGFVRLQQILAVYPVARSTLLQMVTQGRFPRPYKISSRAVAWKVEDVRKALAGFAQVDAETIDKNVKAAIAAKAKRRAELLGA